MSSLHKLIVLVLVLLVTACGASGGQVIYPELGLTGPCTVESWKMYLDGGSWGGVITDSKGKKLEVCWDGRMRIVGEGDLAAPRLAFINAQHPTHAGATALPLGSDAELELITLFDEWVSSQIPANEVDRWVAIYFDYTLVLEERLRQLPELTDEQKTALAVAATSSFLKKQRRLGHASGPEE